MTSPYKRRKPSLIRNFWVYRRLILAAMVLGLLLWFVVINSTPATVYFPFRLGQIASTTGILVLLGAFAGSIVTALLMTIFLAVRHYRSGQPFGPEDATGSDLLDDRPPTDYAAKTTEGFSDAPWSKG